MLLRAHQSSWGLLKVAGKSDSLWPHELYSHEILQARILEWIAFPFSRGSSQPRDRTQSPALQVDLYQLSHRGKLTHPESIMTDSLPYGFSLGPTLTPSYLLPSVFFFFFFLYLSLSFWLHQILVVARGIFIVVHGFLPSCDVQAWFLGCRLSCLKACGILVPQPEIEPVSSALEGGFLTTVPPVKSPSVFPGHHFAE